MSPAVCDHLDIDPVGGEESGAERGRATGSPSQIKR
jgi:hypothetical protein